MEGTSPGDVAALERILKDNHSGHGRANSRQLNAMSEVQLRTYRLLIAPWGNFEAIDNGLTSSPTAPIRDAGRGGLNHLGMCKGAHY